MSSDNDSQHLKNIKNRPRGRPTGSSNSGDYKELLLKCEKKKIDLFDELLKLCKDPDPEIRGRNIERALPYIYAKRKAIEISGSLNVNHEEDTKTLEFLKALDAKGRLKVEPPSSNS